MCFVLMPGQAGRTAGGSPGCGTLAMARTSRYRSGWTLIALGPSQGKDHEGSGAPTQTVLGPPSPLSVASYHEAVLRRRSGASSVGRSDGVRSG